MSLHHPSQDQLIDLVYGIGEPSDHLAECPACQERFQAFIRAQRQPLPAEFSANFYHQQRRRILDRLAEPARPMLSRVWVPAAVAALMAVGLVISRPVKSRTAPASHNSVEIKEASLDESETGWFEDTYTEMQGSEPRALSPMRSLFAEGSHNQ